MFWTVNSGSEKQRFPEHACDVLLVHINHCSMGFLFVHTNQTVGIATILRNANRVENPIVFTFLISPVSGLWLLFWFGPFCKENFRLCRPTHPEEDHGKHVQGLRQRYNLGTGRMKWGHGISPRRILNCVFVWPAPSPLLAKKGVVPSMAPAFPRVMEVGVSLPKEQSSPTVDGQNPLRTTLKPGETNVCWYLQGNQSIPGFASLCRLSSIHSTKPSCQLPCLFLSFWPLMCCKQL